MESDSRFVGRSLELAALVEVLSQLRRGRGSATLVCGDAGIGKTRLVLEAGKRGSKDIKWAVGQCLQESLVPYGPVFNVLSAVGVALEPLQEITMQSRGDSFAKLRFCRATITALEELSKSHPVAIFFDDIQWADPETLEFLGFLYERLEHHSMALIVACRSTDLSKNSDLEPLINRILHRKILKLELATLTPDESRQIASAVLTRYDAIMSEERLGYILSLAEGNPLYLEELLRDALERREGHIPDAVRIMADSRLRSLDSATQRLVLVSSVFTDSFSSAQLAEILDWPNYEIKNRLQEAYISGFIIEQSEGTYRFSHALIREGIRKRLTIEFAKGIHAKIARSLERLAAHDSRTLGAIGHHYRSAGMLPEALRYNVAAGDAASQESGYGAATEFFMRALSDATALGNEALVTRKLADALLLNGRTERAVYYYERAIGESPSSDLENRTQLIRGLANAYHRSGKYRDAIATIERLVESLNGDPRSVPRDLMFLAAICEFDLMQADRSSWYSRVEALIDEFDPPAQCLFRVIKAFSHVSSENVASATKLCDHSIEVARTLGDDHLVARLLILKAGELTTVGSVSDALASCEEAIAHVRSDKIPWQPEFRILQISAYYRYSYELTLAGRFREARDLLDDVGDLTFDTTIARIVGLSAKIRVGALCCSGLPPYTKIESFPELLELSLESGHQGTFMKVAQALAIYYRTVGNLDDARRVLHATLLKLTDGMHAQDMLLLVAEFGDWNDIEVARTFLRRSLAFCVPAKRIGYAELFEAFVLRRQGKRASARRRGHRASTELEHTGERYRWAQALELAGNKQAAATQFAEMGAVFDHQRLTGLRQPNHGNGLTRRQEQLRRLVERGYSNAEIAGELGISEGTVRVHLTEVFRRSGVRSRGQLIASQVAANDKV